ncbi:ras-related protein Rab-38-like [Vespula squamosa]|uniref:Ras-related protein Rab-38-like n=1 Tax=Vespula squamosa TaxID=30214 RepID=A0ABD2A8B8_VESSQ
MDTRKLRRDSDVVLSNVGRRELLFKFLVIGDYGVGKTALVRRYTEGNATKIYVIAQLLVAPAKQGSLSASTAQLLSFPGKFSSNYKITIGADFAIKTLDWDSNTKINLQLWYCRFYYNVFIYTYTFTYRISKESDIAGHERFGYMTRVYYKYAYVSDVIVAAALVFDISRAATFQSMKKWLSDLREKVTLPDGSSIPVVLLANKCDIRHVAVSTEQIVKFCKENNIGEWYVTSAKENTNVDEAIRHLVENVLRAKIEGGIRDSIRLRDDPIERGKTGCCKF